MPKYFAVLFIVLLSLTARAQTWEVGGSVGASAYIGDLNTNNLFKPSGGYGGVFVKRNFDRYLGLRLNFVYGQISGDDSKSSIEQFRQRNLSFTDPLTELSLTLDFNFMSYIPDAGKNKYTPYVFLGLGGTSYAPRTMYNQQQISLRHLQTEGTPYGSTALVVPFGAGFKYNISGKWTLGAELGYRYTNTDFLDDVSGVYKAFADPNSESARFADRSGEVGAGPAIVGSQRGDFKPRDFYSYFGLTLSYTFVTSKCYY
ncbi:MAG: outer membrane beta-barrel protein [Mucilaginibacter sp.]|nr:outer membrane beta-barrel protein [Mucilaginibacter sp.]